MTNIDTFIAKVTARIPSKVSAGSPSEEDQQVVVGRLTAALLTEDRPASPNFPEVWKSEPNVMFECDQKYCDPRPKPFPWGAPRWATEQKYDEDLSKFLGSLACGGDAPEALALSLARRAIDTPRWVNERHRLWPKRVAGHLISPECPPAKGLPEDVRGQLEQLAAQGDAATAPPEASGSVPVE